jgi:hypothetical protein
MSRRLQGTLLGIGIVVAVIILLAAADAGSGARCAAQFPKWLGCILGAREGLAGGLIGAGGAIFAGWLAWMGVRDQVQAERELATARATESLKAILTEMKELFDTLNEIWRVIDVALLPEQTAEQRRYRIAVAKSIMATLPADKTLKEVKDFTDALAKEIAPNKRGQFIRYGNRLTGFIEKKVRKGLFPKMTMAAIS